jgi:hypothetical protein
MLLLAKADSPDSSKSTSCPWIRKTLLDRRAFALPVTLELPDPRWMLGHSQ